MIDLIVDVSPKKAVLFNCSSGLHLVTLDMQTWSPEERKWLAEHVVRYGNDNTTLSFSVKPTREDILAAVRKRLAAKKASFWARLFGKIRERT